MSDGVVLDEDAAWQLFGSSDIAGQSVMIGETPHHVAGVIERPDDRLSRKAGLNKSVVLFPTKRFRSMEQAMESEPMS